MDTSVFIPGDELKRGVVPFGKADADMFRETGTVDVGSVDDL